MRKLIFLLLTALLFSCDPVVMFTEPQPEGKKDLASFPARYRGTYMELSDSSIYLVTAERILEKHEEFLSDPESEILEDSEIEIIADTLIIKEMNLKFPVSRRNDSVFGLVVLYDTVFDIKGESRLRKLGKTYFMNIPSDSLWMVFKLQFDKSGHAFLCGVEDEEEVKIFEQYCKVKIHADEDGNPKKYILAPSVKELRKILKTETFTDTTEYVRISQSTLR
ncbi:hypothetical protein ACFLTU_04250 [Bacteroidota bacterium]